MRALFQPSRDTIQLTAVLAALSDSHRLDIVLQLMHVGEQSCGTFVSPIARSTLTHHMKVLREAGVTHTRVEGTQRFVSVRTADLDARFPGLLQAILGATPPF